MVNCCWVVSRLCLLILLSLSLLFLHVSCSSYVGGRVIRVTRSKLDRQHDPAFVREQERQLQERLAAKAAKANKTKKGTSGKGTASSTSSGSSGVGQKRKAQEKEMTPAEAQKLTIPFKPVSILGKGGENAAASSSASSSTSSSEQLKAILAARELERQTKELERAVKRGRADGDVGGGGAGAGGAGGGAKGSSADEEEEGEVDLDDDE